MPLPAHRRAEVDIILVPGGMRFSSQIDRGVEAALRAAGHSVRTLCRPCLATIGQGALAELAADLLLSIHGRQFPHALLANAPGIRVKAVWLLDEPQEVDMSEGYGRHFDMVLTNDRNTCGIHGTHKCWYLPLAADPEVHKPSGAEKAADVCFVGSMNPFRAALLTAARDLAPDLRWLVVGPNRSGIPCWWENRSVGHEEYVQLYASAHIGLNVPGDALYDFANRRANKRSIPASGLGCRPFEVTGTGTFLLTDDGRADVSSFWPRGAIGIYRRGDAMDLAAQLRYWRDRDLDRELAAAQARGWTLDHHTYAHRVRELAGVVQAWLDTRTPGAAPAQPRRAPTPARRAPREIVRK
jgi:spore maturation protein CgeB